MLKITTYILLAIGYSYPLIALWGELSFWPYTLLIVVCIGCLIASALKVLRDEWIAAVAVLIVGVSLSYGLGMVLSTKETVGSTNQKILDKAQQQQ